MYYSGFTVANCALFTEKYIGDGQCTTDLGSHFDFDCEEWEFDGGDCVAEGEGCGVGMASSWLLMMDNYGDAWGSYGTLDVALSTGTSAADVPGFTPLTGLRLDEYKFDADCQFNCNTGGMEVCLPADGCVTITMNNDVYQENAWALADAEDAAAGKPSIHIHPPCSRYVCGTRCSLYTPLFTPNHPLLNHPLLKTPPASLFTTT